MASIHKRKKSPFWVCCYRAADGRRLKKSTEETDRTKALEMCLQIERAEKLAARGTLTETRARELIGEVLERSTGETLPFFSAESWLREWLRGKSVSKAAGTLAKYTHTIESFIRHLDGRARLTIAAINPADVSTYRDAQLASGKNPNTVRYLIKQLRIPFNVARRQGLITVNPAEAVELPSKTKTEGGEETSREAFTPEQVRALMDAATIMEHGQPVFKAGEDWKSAILFACFTGARLQDIANITWQAIDLPSKLITYREKKKENTSGKEVIIPIHPDLEQCLLGMSAPDSSKAFVFPKLAGKSPGGGSGLSMQFSRIMARANVAGKTLHSPKAGSKGRTVRSLTFHSLRHTFNSALANAGVSQEIRMMFTGHSSADMNKKYTHLEIEPLRQATALIPRITSTKAAE